MPFERGKSGNPGGRPRKSEQQVNFEEKCRNWAALYAFDKLKKLADSEDEKAIQWATKELLDRGFGKSVETSVVEAHVTSDTGSTVEALADELAQVIGGAEAEGGGHVGPAQVDAGK